MPDDPSMIYTRAAESLFDLGVIVKDYRRQWAEIHALEDRVALLERTIRLAAEKLDAAHRETQKRVASSWMLRVVMLVDEVRQWLNAIMGKPDADA